MNKASLGENGKNSKKKQTTAHQRRCQPTFEGVCKKYKEKKEIWEKEKNCIYGLRAGQKGAVAVFNLAEPRWCASIS